MSESCWHNMFKNINIDEYILVYFVCSFFYTLRVTSTAEHNLTHTFLALIFELIFRRKKLCVVDIWEFFVIHATFFLKSKNKTIIREARKMSEVIFLLKLSKQTVRNHIFFIFFQCVPVSTKYRSERKEKKLLKFI